MTKTKKRYSLVVLDYKETANHPTLNGNSYQHAVRSESIAVSSKNFFETIKGKLVLPGKGRKIIKKLPDQPPL
jgi:hypothetical protein